MADIDILNVGGAFSNADKTVVNWEGRNYYQSCDEPVVVNSEGATTHCVKRVDHPGDIHEDMDGVRKTVDKGRMTVVVSFPLNADTHVGFAETLRILQSIKPIFADRPEIQVYGAVKDMADQIIMIMEGDG